MHEKYLTVVLVAIVLGADAFSLSMGMGIQGVSSRFERRFAALVAVFHVLMPLLGLSLGMVAGNFLGIWAGRVGAVIMAYIGLTMFWKAYQETKPQSLTFSEAQELFKTVPTINDSWVILLLLTVSVSIDALTVGFGLGIIKAPILLTVLIMGLIAGSMTMLGFKGGKLFSRMIGSYSQAFGGLVLLALAIKVAF